jgi:hypothetical protein
MPHDYPALMAPANYALCIIIKHCALLNVFFHILSDFGKIRFHPFRILIVDDLQEFFQLSTNL